MEHLQFLFEKVTGYQLISIFWISVFTIYEIQRLTKRGASKYFLPGFKIRSICMIFAFLFISYSWTFLISFVSIIWVVLFEGNFYTNRQLLEKEKIKTLGCTIPGNKFGQICLWFFIDIFAYFFWMIFIPWLIDFLIAKDVVLCSKLF